MKKLQRPVILDGPILDKVKINFSPSIDFKNYPFCLNIIKSLKEITFPTKVTFFIGENGTGKSTILEAIANQAGFGPEGGSKNMYFKTSQEETNEQQLGQQLTLSWRNKPNNGYFFRAESFFNIANYIDIIAKEDQRIYDFYGGKSLHAQSHGESFMAFFENRLGQEGFFILDEPEAALSPQRQLTFLFLINEICKNSNAQFIIATHSPILLAFPNATIYSCDSGTLTQISYHETNHYKITKQFLDNPEQYLYHLFKD